MILDFDLYKNRELEWNVKDKKIPETEKWRQDVAVLDAGYRAEEFNPQITLIIL
jgi:hypothetical protein